MMTLLTSFTSSLSLAADAMSSDPPSMGDSLSSSSVPRMSPISPESASEPTPPPPPNIRSRVLANSRLVVTR
ncbi:hypothetical protein D3C83_149640 [compost metagenome]